MRLKIILLTFLTSICAISAGAAVNASTFMKEASEKITSVKSVTASFKIECAGQQPVTGNIAVAGDKFAVNSSVSSTIYDGNTQWTISSSDKEISIFEPTADEIAQVNPFAVIKSYNRDYSVKAISSDNSTVKMQLTPKNSDSAIKRITVSFETQSKLPKSMVITLDDGTTLYVSISDIRTNADIKASRFAVSQKDYPGYDIIDLR